ncbi:MAG: bifunctional 4-hydroxy-2-oxoglutarate aldolase/2-dehydro-3-deoxy-phosphogluconate aldolase [Chitinophagaceae bacterium]|nr:MAG: bifunctional 4-hydroxy-2-oxoglutarate aldolase/2-dehydro-3-deoxy-phosphogluconate aldolase [Chitinophagaceae bacterium]
MNKFSWEAFNVMPVVGIIRNLPTDDLIRIATCYADAGMTTIEITLNTPGALDSINALNKALGNRLNIGAGTVCSDVDLDQAINAGAGFIVTPVINESVIRKCVENKIAIFPGAYTPSEIYYAWSLGAEMIKVFPATRLGPDYIRDVLAPLNKIKLLPTGGVSLENCGAYFKSGASGVGMGSNLFPKDLIINKDWIRLESHFKEYVTLVKDMIG